MVGFPLFHRHAVIIPAPDGIAGVFEAIDAPHTEHEIRGIGRCDAPFLRYVMRPRAGYIPIRVLLSAQFRGYGNVVSVVIEVFEFERVVDDHFRIQTAVARLIDVLKKQAVEMLADLYAAFVLVERVSYHDKLPQKAFFALILT